MENFIADVTWYFENEEQHDVILVQGENYADAIGNICDSYGNDIITVTITGIGTGNIIHLGPKEKITEETRKLIMENNSY